MQISQLPTSTIFNSADVIAIEINGTTYKIAGANLATALKTLGNYVGKTGDTMTGALVVESPATISEKSTAMDLTTNPSTSIYSPAIYSKDKNDVNVSQIDSVQYTNGQTAIRLLVYNYDTSGERTVVDGPQIYASRAGAITYRIPNPQAFRDAISSPATPEPLTFTAGSGVTLTRNNSIVIGKYIIVSAVIQTTAAITGATTTLLTLPSDITIYGLSDLTALTLNGTTQYSLVAPGSSSIIRANLGGSTSMPAGYYHIVGTIRLT